MSGKENLYMARREDGSFVNPMAVEKEGGDFDRCADCTAPLTCRDFARCIKEPLE